MTQIVNIRISSSDIGLVKPQSVVKLQQGEPDIDALKERPYIPPWRDVSERDYLNRSRPGPTGAERAFEDALWNQVTGQDRNKPPSSQFKSDWAKLQNSLARSFSIEDQLFNEIKSSFGKLPTNCQPLTRER